MNPRHGISWRCCIRKILIHDLFSLEYAMRSRESRKCGLCWYGANVQPSWVRCKSQLCQSDLGKLPKSWACSMIYRWRWYNTPWICHRPIMKKMFLKGLGIVLSSTSVSHQLDYYWCPGKEGRQEECGKERRKRWGERKRSLYQPTYDFL